MDDLTPRARARAAVVGFGGAVDGGARGGGDAGRPRGSRGGGQGPHNQGARNLPALRRDTCLEDGRLTDSALIHLSFFLCVCVCSSAHKASIPYSVIYLSATFKRSMCVV